MMARTMVTVFEITVSYAEPVVIKYSTIVVVLR